MDRDGQQYLPAVCRRDEPRHPVEGGAEVVVPALVRRTSMQGHPHPQGADPTPPLREQRALGRERRLQRLRGRGEDRAEGVADRLEDVTAAPFYVVPQDRIVAVEGGLHRRCVSLPQPGGPFDVGEEEGYGACG